MSKYNKKTLTTVYDADYPINVGGDVGGGNKPIEVIDVAELNCYQFRIGDEFHDVLVCPNLAIDIANIIIVKEIEQNNYSITAAIGNEDENIFLPVLMVNIPGHVNESSYEFIPYIVRDLALLEDFSSSFIRADNPFTPWKEIDGVKPSLRFANVPIGGS